MVLVKLSFSWMLAVNTINGAMSRDIEALVLDSWRLMLMNLLAWVQIIINSEDEEESIEKKI